VTAPRPVAFSSTSGGKLIRPGASRAAELLVSGESVAGTSPANVQPEKAEPRSGPAAHAKAGADARIIETPQGGGSYSAAAVCLSR
jgi:hypothetical protein